jgi:SAM-dependent methyltransferase
MALAAPFARSVANMTDHERLDLLQDALGLTAPLNTNIHKNDQMLSFVASVLGSKAVARSEYFSSGAQLVKILEQLVRWKFGSFDNLSSFLDFASGYGRLTRFLIQKLPPDRIWVSDIQADAVAFQQAEFGVDGFVSTVDPDDLACDQRFDCIFVASLFSHLPPATFGRWLKRLYSLLRPGGLLAFSVHDESRLPPGYTMPETGIWFAQASEIASQDTKDYGLAIVTEAFVCDAIAAATGQSAPAYRRIRYGLHYHQDIYLVVNEPQPNFSGLRFDYLPHGAVDYALWVGPGELFVRGWAIALGSTGDMGGARSGLEVQIFVNGQLQQKCAPRVYRPDLGEYFKDEGFSHAGWECSCHLPDINSFRSMVVKAVSAGGAESVLYIGSIDSLLPRGSVEMCRWTRPGELYVKGWAVGITDRDSPPEVQVLVDGQLKQKVLPFIHRPDLQEQFRNDRFSYVGWECSCRVAEDDPTQIMTVKSISTSRVEPLLYTGSIASLLTLTSPDVDAAITFPEDGEQRPDYPPNREGEWLRDWLRDWLHYLQIDRDMRLDYIRQLESELGRKNDALADLEARLRSQEHQRLGRARFRWPWQRRSPKAPKDAG